MGRLPQKLQDIRKLDIDDLLIITMFSEGRSYTEIADALCLTIPAIYHRTHKIRGIWGDAVFPNRQLKIKISPLIEEKGSRTRAVLKELNSWFEEKEAV